jgi:hypothetical protein
MMVEGREKAPVFAKGYDAARKAEGSRLSRWLGFVKYPIAPGRALRNIQA